MHYDCFDSAVETELNENLSLLLLSDNVESRTSSNEVENIISSNQYDNKNEKLNKLKKQNKGRRPLAS